MPEIIPIQGRHGRALQNGIELREVTGVRAEIEIAEQVVQQSGGNWEGSVDGPISCTGTFNAQKNSSRFELQLIDYLRMTPQRARELRAQGKVLRPTFELEIVLDDPAVLGGYESITLLECRILNLPIGWEDRTGIVMRTYKFRAEGMLPLDPTSTIPVPAPGRSALAL